MQRLIIEGGARLRGELDVQGAKNSSLPILAATLLSGGESVIHNVPKLSDVSAALEILKHLGCKIKLEKDAVIVNSEYANLCDIPEKLMHEMRSSIVFLGAILSRAGKAYLSFPGGCELGARPIDLHIDALQKMGAKIEDKHGFLICESKNGLTGAKLPLGFPSVGATENIMLAATMAKGETIILNAAQEPEIVDLANFLTARGAKIKGAGESTIVIEGVSKLHSAEYTVMPDRIAALTYMAAAGITGGEIILNGVRHSDMESALPVFEESGSKLKIYDDKIKITGPSIIRPVNNIKTMPYPGFPTDAQAPVMAMLTLSSGTSVFVENIFENRYKHTPELSRMGADIKVEGKVAVVRGVQKLYGASVNATDLRGGAALCVAALAAEGKSKINGTAHIDRGYQEIEREISLLGGRIKRERYET